MVACENKNKYKDVKTELENLGCKVEFDVPMATLTSFKIGGPVDILVSLPAENLAETIVKVKKICAQNNLPTLMLGNGTNMLVCDGGIRGVALKLNEDETMTVEEKDGYFEIVCGAGASLKNLCRFARDHALMGLEFAYGIPGSVGGGLYMNAGAYGGEMAHVVTWAEGVFTDEVRRVALADMKLGYRHSVFMEESAIITRAGFKLVKGDLTEINAKMTDLIGRRRDKQPLEFPSGGSFFKRPPGNFAGSLIEKSGLKGVKIGGAQVSEKHAGFVVNAGGATCGDISRLCEHVRAVVFEKFGITLEREVLFIDENCEIK